MTKINELYALGQSVWYDNIERDLINSGQLQALIDEGIVGLTSNPSIFQKAISGSDAYDADLRALAGDGKSALEIFEALAIDDLQRAADLLYPVFEETNGKDGYVSLEVNPNLAYDTEGTIAEARRLFAALGRRNAMIKVPATQAGIPAIATLIGEGININITLLFSNDNYQEVVEAYLEGLEALAREGGDVSRVASVASFFVSRVDGKVDKALAAIGNETLQGKIAIANAKIAYTIFEALFSGERWEHLAAAGAQPQRLLWASTSTKNPDYSDVLYVDGLIGPDTVNTAPPQTIEAFLDHGTIAVTLTVDVDEARSQLAALAEAGIDLDAITAALQVEGVEAFASSFNDLIASIEAERLRAAAQGMGLSVTAEGYQELIANALENIAAENIISRIWAEDYTVWGSEPEEISNRLGWLNIANEMLDNIDRLEAFVSELRENGYTDVVLLGMGGSSLAPELFGKVFGTAEGYLNLTVIDSTDPTAILNASSGLDLEKTLFVVATKSGGTAETMSLFKYFYNQVVDALGQEEAGRHFVAITDGGSKLETLAGQFHFRELFLNNPNIGGRYSALSYFGLVPAALIGVDTRRLLNEARIAACNAGGEGCEPGSPNVAAVLGAVIGELAKQGRDKLTLIISPDAAAFGEWVEQLIAESTGKNGTGILPVVGEAVDGPEVFGEDRLFVYLRLDGDDTFDAQVDALEADGQPVVRLALSDLYELGRQFLLWELATAVAGRQMGIQPFNQPNVEAAKVQARQMIAAYKETGTLPKAEVMAPDPGALQEFLAGAEAGDYIAVQAYIPPTRQTDESLGVLREWLRNHTGLAATVGYGPRFLHSTGQLHKGDAGNGWFIQLTADMPVDLPIPDEAGKDASSISFGLLKTAQALGDAAALREAGRPLIHFDLGADIDAGIAALTTYMPA
ncbi:MAG: bifunctional transaldolase/phosoglucose isomerase [Candidatus Promineifilaceae bacterium]